MLLRSSSTPLAQTLLPDSPNREFDHHRHHQSHDHKFSFIHGVHHHLSLSSFSSTSSPISSSSSGFSRSNSESNTFCTNAFRRAQSDSNLDQLASNLRDFSGSNTLAGRLHKHKKAMLRTEPSFSIYHTDDEKEDSVREDANGNLVRSITIGDSIDALGSGEFSFGSKDMGLIEEKDEEEEETLNEFHNMDIVEIEPVSPPMYLATGFAVGGSGIDGSSFDLIDFNLSNFDDNGNLEEYYKRMSGEDPSNPLILRNYAQLLVSKGDLVGAEDYYHRAILADNKDGEIMSQYAKLVWQLHRDKERALYYFESAARAAPEDSNVLAAYANFLWENDIDEEEDRELNDQTQMEANEGQFKLQKTTFQEENRPSSPPLHLAAGLGIEVTSFAGGIGTLDYTTMGYGEVSNSEDYYKKMVEEDPCNPLFLRNYAQFLLETKGDLHGAEEYYSRAILADPGDGEVISHYAKLVWQLYHDRAKALCYFEQAVQATPGDSHILAAYASFLWETEEDEDDEHHSQKHKMESPVLQGAVSSSGV